MWVGRVCAGVGVYELGGCGLGRAVSGGVGAWVQMDCVGEEPGFRLAEGG